MAVLCENPLVVFERVTVDFVVTGGARINWYVSPHFHGPEPWSLQVQTAESDLLQANWVDVGTPVQNTCFVIDPEWRVKFGKEPNIFYRVKLTDADNVTYTSEAIHALDRLDFKSWNYFLEIQRKELIRLRALNVGVNAWLLKIKRSGTPCQVCLDQFTQEVTNSNCPTCYGSSWEGGYYEPEPLVYADITGEETYLQRATEDGMGMVAPMTVRGMCLANPHLITMDIIVNHHTDVRYHVHNVSPRTHIRGVPTLVTVDLRPVPFDNVVYKFPVPRTYPPCPVPGC
jgi:hypothetical protein